MYVLMYIINKLVSFFVGGTIKFVFCTICFSELSVLPHPHHYPGNQDYSVF